MINIIADNLANIIISTVLAVLLSWLLLKSKRQKKWKQLLQLPRMSFCKMRQ